MIEAEQPDDHGGPAPRPSPEPEEVPEPVPDPPEENPEEVAGEGDPQGDPGPQGNAAQPYRQVLQGFRTVAPDIFSRLQQCQFRHPESHPDVP